MSESFITQCPHCQTSFRVSRAQLGAANGAVRCGACLKVFSAPQHILAEPGAAEPEAETRAEAPAQPEPAPPVAPVDAEPPQSAPEPAPAAAESAKKADETLWIHDDLDLETLDFDEELAKLDEFELSQEFLSIEGAPKPAQALLNQRAEARDPYDERWAEELLEEHVDEPDERRQEPSLGNLQSIDDGEHEEPPEVAARPEIAAEPEVEAGVEPVQAELDVEPEPAPLKVEEDEDLPSFSARRDDVLAVDEPEDEPEALREPRPEPALRDESLRELHEEPLHLGWEKPRRHWGRRILWLLLILIALGGLVFQYIAYHFDELARQDEYRPWFAQVCPSLGCTLPSKVDVEQIRSSNLVVRSHPDFTGALVVDAIIYNRASFSQPFPLLELRFADLNGQLLASRQFKPGEYLSGELAGQSEMPPQTPIHISLDILDPGPRAVNYSLSFHSPE
ncbi:DUF3426 domain-containing protein [Pseudomonas jinjuensis]|uniref:MJ0042 family finger-like domain-containing protein n=1 Tax=Pseudomonas jinjuensis TaxID=198616 RepID=A0A1H0NKQ6_9PSED|nr:DUF3426 domain-containing protein [Pseudomonas jinjuensis]SDO93253.1 MJ0042 family finger-like domain-containing protein [Pseudomonas jinjuensis]